ncbi:hypothetical protein EMIT0196P_210028 [Pseudomonas chlororaphis]
MLIFSCSNNRCSPCWVLSPHSRWSVITRITLSSSHSGTAIISTTFVSTMDMSVPSEGRVRSDDFDSGGWNSGASGEAGFIFAYNGRTGFLNFRESLFLVLGQRSPRQRGSEEHLQLA